MELPPSSSAKPDLSQHDKPDNNHDAIKFWTQKEKFHLIQALKTYGRQDIEKVQKYVITKNLDETKAAIDYFSGIALHHTAFKKQKEKEKKLSEWEKLLKDNFKSNELKTETATAIRLIADLEKIPARQVTEDIDFRQVYHQITNALEGKPMTPDLATCAVLHKCVTETAKACKAFIKTAETRSIINNIDLSDKQTNMFPKPTENQELAILRHLASQLSYNPLKVPEEHLKSSTPNFETPSTSFVETTSTSNVETTSTSYVETTSTSYVETPSTSFVETTSTSNVETPSNSYIETPTSYFEPPSTSYFETPSTSGIETPSTSNDVLRTGVPNPGRMRNQSKGKKGKSKGRKKGGFKAKGDRERE